MDPLEALATLLGPHAAGLCDACLGRLGSRVAADTSPRDLGAHLRTANGSRLPVLCELCEGLLDRVPVWIERCLAACRDFEFSTFLVGSVTFAEIRGREVAIFEDLQARDKVGLAKDLPVRTNPPPWPGGEWLKTQINREVGQGIEAHLAKKVDFERPELTFRLDTRFDHVELQVADLFAKGRYRKFVRDLPQTRWPCRACGGLGCRQCGGSGKTYESSVEELVAAPFLAAADAAGEAFHGMGREDIDARTLGTGRPFVLELKRPRRRTLDWSGLQEAVNASAQSKVEIDHIGPAGPGDAARYKAADPPKTYHAVCVAEEPIDEARLRSVAQDLEGVELQQRTPERVAHRRADLVRRRRIHSVRVLSHDGARFQVEIRADSGTYIKEFVSGDEGRTRPSLAERLGVACRVAELDVVDVDWTDAPNTPLSVTPP